MLIDPGDATSEPGTSDNRNIKITGAAQTASQPGIDSRKLMDTLTLNEFRAVLRQHHDLELGFRELPRLLRTAGVYRQSGDPRSKWESAFWFTGSSWTVHHHAVFKLAEELRRAMFLLQSVKPAGYVQPQLDFTIPASTEPAVHAQRQRNGILRPTNRDGGAHPRDNRP
jgi:hypothetical protein